MIKVPVFFHELFGEFQTKSSLLLILVFVLISGGLLTIFGYHEWKDLSLLKQVVTWLVFLDISGGVIANLTEGTDRYYEEFPKKRWVFIAIHIQPILLSWSLEISLFFGFMLYAYTLISASLLNFTRKHPLHTLLAGGFTGLGFIIVAHYSLSVPFLATVLFLFYIFKVLFSFSVHHHKGGRSNA